MRIKEKTKPIRDMFGKRICDVVDTPNGRFLDVKTNKQSNHVYIDLNMVEEQAGPYKIETTQ